MEKEFNGVTLSVIETGDNRQWSMTVEEAAKGYGVTSKTVRNHISNHCDEIRDGIERGTQTLGTLGGEQKHTVLYREGVIKLGFFIKSKSAAIFRQWATNLVVQHLDNKGMDIGQVLDAIGNLKENIAEVQRGLSGEIVGVHKELSGAIAGVKVECRVMRDDLDEVRELLHLYISDSDEKAIREIMKKVKEKTGLDGRAIVGNVRKSLNLASIYDPPHVRQVINALNNMLGSGLVLLT
jgi:prophage antirepressor-like protein